MTDITAVVMLAPVGKSPVEQLMGDGLMASAADLLWQLRSQTPVKRLIVAAPHSALHRLRHYTDVDFVPEADDESLPFVFGNRLADLTRKYDIEQLAYFGAGSAPLLADESLGDALATLQGAQGALAVANNLHSADWVLMNRASNLLGIAHRLERDNMLAWVLREELGYEVRPLPPTAATRLDIDTPFDLQVLAMHNNTKPAMRRFAQERQSVLKSAALARSAQILRTPGSRLTLIGRVSAAAWSYLESKARLWTRVLSEERGMAANRRQSTGQVYSIIAHHIGQVGEEAFVDELARVSDLTLFDSRVYLAHYGSLPAAADRFASDLGQAGEIADDRLRRLTMAVANSSAPIVLGGHNVVSGGLYALMEIAEGGDATSRK